MDFEWDTDKADINVEKHGVTFEEAQTVFNDGLAAFFDDVLHSDHEDRYLIVGYSNQDRLLYVSHTVRSEKIRIISARAATKRERETHERENKRSR
ncbi:MAG: BrnT family toxin [Armatimonadetes bacterium]|nr:BrnT family toxin [Armatimonadota bacterium]